jgi:hypothetical protein
MTGSTLKKLTDGVTSGPDLASWPGHWHAIAYAAASGILQRDIAQDLGLSEPELAAIACKPEIKARVKVLKEKLIKSSDKILVSNAPFCAELMVDVARAQGPGLQAKLSERIDASKWVLEKTTGKAKQAEDATAGNTYINVINMLDGINKRIESGVKATEAEEREVYEVISKPVASDWMDDFVSKNKASK